MKRNDETPTDRGDRQVDGRSINERDHTGRSCDCGSSNEEIQAGPKTSDPSSPRLVSRVLVTWIELTVVGITGGLLGGTVSGPPGFVIYLATTVLIVGVIFYNVNELIKKWVRLH